VKVNFVSLVLEYLCKILGLTLLLKIIACLFLKGKPIRRNPLFQF